MPLVPVGRIGRQADQSFPGRGCAYCLGKPGQAAFSQVVQCEAHMGARKAEVGSEVARLRGQDAIVSHDNAAASNRSKMSSRKQARR